MATRVLHPDAETLTKVCDIGALTRAWRELEQRFAEGSERERRFLGTQIGAHPHRLYVREDLRVWMAPHRLIARGYIWAPFGTLPMKTRGNLNMVVQINRVSRGSRAATAALLAVDTAGDSWICHTGRIGGGRPGISKSAFLAWSDREPANVVHGRNIEQAFPIARLGDRDMAHDIALFVHEVAAFKAEVPSPARRAESRNFGGSAYEPEGSSQVARRRGYEVVRVHGMVRNRLRDLIAAIRPETHRDGPRDIIVGNPNAPDFEFEIKPCSDPQSLYTAVGQLFVHSQWHPAKRRVAVLPDDIRPRDVTVLRKLGIELVTFRIEKNRIVYSGLDRLIPGVASTAPRHLPFAPTPPANQPTNA